MTASASHGEQGGGERPTADAIAQASALPRPSRRQDGGKGGGEPDVEVTMNDRIRAQYERQRYGLDVTAADLAKQRQMEEMWEQLDAARDGLL